MRIGTRLTLVIFAVALIPLVLSAVLTIVLSTQILTTEILNHLESVAEIQSHRIQQSLSQNYDKLNLVTSRISLLESLNSFLLTGDERERESMTVILAAAKASVDTFRNISVVDPNGIVVASTDTADVGQSYAAMECFTKGIKSNTIHVFLLDDSKKLNTHFAGPLFLNQKLLGAVVVTDNTDYLISLVSDYTGLGNTGETLLARKDSDGKALFLTPLRFDLNAALVRVERDMSRPINIALSGKEQTLTDAPDYRGVSVLAATRYLPDFGWGLVAKIDRAEALEPIDSLRNSLIVIFMFAIVAIGFVSYYLAHTISGPIVSIHRAASAISKGDYSQRAVVESNDEIGMLATSFNTMSDDLIVANYGLERRVNERTEELRKATEEIRRLNADLEMKVIERTAQLQRANAELDSFSYSVSHDLRAPLRGIDGWSQALLEDYRDKLGKQGQQYIDHVRAEAQRMGQLIDDMLKLARVTRTEIHWAQVNITELAQSISVRLLRESPLERQVEFVIQPGLTAWGDASLIEIAMFNLIDNAWKFTGKQPEGRIEIGTVIHDGINAFYIRDNGVGFDMTYASKLFGAFQRLHKLSEFPGTGIGLATVQRIIHRHGGRVWAEAQVDKGAAFYFTLREG